MRVVLIIGLVVTVMALAGCDSQASRDRAAAERARAEAEVVQAQSQLAIAQAQGDVMRSQADLPQWVVAGAFLVICVVVGGGIGLLAVMRPRAGVVQPAQQAPVIHVHLAAPVERPGLPEGARWMIQEPGETRYHYLLRLAEMAQAEEVLRLEGPRR